MNGAAVNIRVQVFVRTYVFISLGYIWRSGVSESHGDSMFNILRNCRLFSRMAAPFYIPLSDILGLLFLHFSLTLVIPFFSFSFSFLFLIIAILVGVKWYLIRSLSYISLMTNVDVEHLLMCFLPFVDLWRNVCADLGGLFSQLFPSGLNTGYFYVVSLFTPHSPSSLPLNHGVIILEPKLE